VFARLLTDNIVCTHAAPFEEGRPLIYTTTFIGLCAQPREQQGKVGIQKPISINQSSNQVSK